MRFNVGDQAELVASACPEDNDFLGEIVTILLVGPFPPGTWFHFGEDDPDPVGSDTHTYDYLVRCHDNAGLVYDWQLRKVGDIDDLSIPRIEEKKHELTAV